jgi:hypothetical protein
MKTIFIQNKYFRWYNSIILSAKNKQVSGYTEKHHIIPKSLGGNNSKDNLVVLTAREHFVCHWLLSKCTYGSKMKYALWNLMHVKNVHQQSRHKITSRVYQLLRESLSESFSVAQKGKRVLSAETRKKMSDTRKARIKSGDIKVNENKEKYKIIAEKRRGTSQSAETKDKIGKAHKGKTLTDEHKKYLSDINKGKSLPDDVKQRISDTSKKQYANGRKAIKGMLGKTMSDEAKEKISAALSGKPKPPRTEEYRQQARARALAQWANRKNK